MGNVAGRGVVAALGILLVPVYIRFLGIEAYALVSFYVLLQTVFGVLDLGLGTTTSRELAIRVAHDERRGEARDVLRTLESIYWLIGVAIGVTIVAAAPFIASRWLQPEALDVATVQIAIVLMGLNAALQWPYTIYEGALNGLQRIFEYNTVYAGMQIVRHVGSVAVLWWRPTVTSFFVWQLVVSAATTTLLVLAAWKYMPRGAAPRVRMHVIAGIWRFAAAMTVTGTLGMVVSYADRVVLSRTLPLKTFGYYSVAATVATGLLYLMAPISLTFLPRFTELLAKKQYADAIRSYHLSAQLMTAALVPLAVVLAAFSREVLTLWTGSTVIAANASTIAAVLLCAILLYALMEIPYMFQLAEGRGTLAAYTNLIAVIVYLPMLAFMVRRYGALGAAVPLLILYAAKFLIWTHVVHTQVLRGEKWRWYVQDVFIPATAAVTVVLLARWQLPQSLFSTLLTGVPLLGAVVAAGAAAAAAAAPLTRRYALAVLPQLRRRLRRS
jgi:O-antigen/teichoic acid export membrane protein